MGYWGSTPREYAIPPIFRGNSSCRNLKEPLKNRLYQMQKNGHKLVLLLAGGSRLSRSKLRINDELNGKIYPQLSNYIQDLEMLIEQKMPNAGREEVKSETKKCLHGKKLNPRLSKLHCTAPLKSFFTHVAMVFMDARIHPEPFMVHFYGDEDFNFLKPAIRIETFDSYMRESNFNFCQVGILELKKKSENNLYHFITDNHGENLLAQGNRSYNLVSHPWKTKTQNCNIWLAEVLASSFYLNKSDWPRTNRTTAKKILAQTDFLPMKVPLSDLQSTARILDLFVGGLNANEGNIDHFYQVADIVPARTITEWLAKNGHFKSIEYIKGSLD